jgi:hypothetical protein
VTFGNLSATWCACCGERRHSCTLVGCKCRCHGGLVSVDASLLRMLGGNDQFWLGVIPSYEELVARVFLWFP